jgi:hypothetical protein
MYSSPPLFRHSIPSSHPPGDKVVSSLRVVIETHAGGDGREGGQHASIWGDGDTDLERDRGRGRAGGKREIG